MIPAKQQQFEFEKIDLSIVRNIAIWDICFLIVFLITGFKLLVVFIFLEYAFRLHHPASLRFLNNINKKLTFFIKKEPRFIYKAPYMFHVKSGFYLSGLVLILILIKFQNSITLVNFILLITCFLTFFGLNVPSYLYSYYNLCRIKLNKTWNKERLIYHI